MWCSLVRVTLKLRTDETFVAHRVNRMRLRTWRQSRTALEEGGEREGGREGGRVRRGGGVSE